MEHATSTQTYASFAKFFATLSRPDALRYTGFEQLGTADFEIFTPLGWSQLSRPILSPASGPSLAAGKSAKTAAAPEVHFEDLSQL